MNYLSVFVTAIIAFFIGALWYSPILFGNAWLKLINVKIDKKAIEKRNKSMWKTMIGGFLTTFVLVFMTDLFLNFLNIVKFSQGLTVGFLIWSGFLATTMFNIVLYEQKPVKLYLINSMHYLVVLMVSAGILAAWA
jgi:hypothetical protein